MTLKGTIISVSNDETFKTTVVRTVVVQHGNSNYPKNACFTLFNDKVSMVSKSQIGSQIEVEYDINARSYTDKNGNEKWMNSLIIMNVKIEKGLHSDESDESLFGSISEDDDEELNF